MQDWINNYFDTHVELLKTLAAIPSPSHHEERRAAFIKDWLDQAGAQGAYIDEAKNVILPFAVEGRNDITVYMAHTDVVFPDETPLPVREESGILYAPGIGDDTANVVGILTAVKYILEHGLQPKEPVLLVLNSCEEGLGNLDGTRRIMKDFAGRIKELISFDGSYQSMIVRAVGSERWKVSCRTVGGHSYSAFGNPNAIHHLAKLINRFYEQPMPDWADQKTTYNVGLISGGTSVNTIAQDAEMLYEYRSDDRKALRFMHDQFFRILVEESESADAHFEAELLGERPCNGEIDPEAWERLLSRCGKVITETVGKPVGRRSASTDANIPLSVGVPATTFGLYLGGKAHTREEWLNIESLRTGLPIAIRLITSHFA